MINVVDVAKGKTIKSKGIALTHKDQGYSANQRPVSLMMKSDLAPEQITADVVKALRQVTVEMSFEEFLRKFFGVWYSDAELLAKLLGFETEGEEQARENPGDDWIQTWNLARQNELEEQMSTISIAKSANEGKELSLPEQYDLIKLQASFEKGVQELGITFDEESKPENTQETGVNKTTAPAATGKAPVENPIEKSKETSVSDTTETTVDVTKSQAFIDLQKQLDAYKARDAEAQEIIKAQVELQKAKAVEKAKAFSFAGEADQTSLVDFILKSENAPVVTLLEKAQTRIAELEAEKAEVVKQFGEKEHGRDGAVTTNDLADDAQARLNARIEKAKEKARSVETTK